MTDRRSVIANSMTFFDEWNGRGKFSFALTDGEHLYVTVTPSQAALALAQLSEFVQRALAEQKSA